MFIRRLASIEDKASKHGLMPNARAAFQLQTWILWFVEKREGRVNSSKRGSQSRSCFNPNGRFRVSSTNAKVVLILH